MGEVWRASHRMLARAAAIKLIKAEALAGPSARQADVSLRRFRREAEAIASLQSPHTVYLYDFGTSRDGRWYYVMELLDGVSLQDLVTHFGPVPGSRVVFVLRQACESLEEAHQQGLVHRDLKPSNIMACKLALPSRLRQSARLRSGEVRGTRRRDAAHAGRHRGRNARLHGARDRVGTGRTWMRAPTSTRSVASHTFC